MSNNVQFEARAARFDRLPVEKTSFLFKNGQIKHRFLLSPIKKEVYTTGFW
jgi:hypothetical protein